MVWNKNTYPQGFERSTVSILISEWNGLESTIHTLNSLFNSIVSILISEWNGLELLSIALIRYNIECFNPNF